MFAIYDIDWLDFCHKHDLWERLIGPSRPSSERVPIVLAIQRFSLSLDHYRDYLDVVQKIDSSLLVFVVLNHSSIVDVSLEVLYIIFNVF